MSFRYPTRQTKGKEPVSQQPGAKKTSKDGSEKVTSVVTVRTKSYVKPFQATVGKDTGRASTSSQPKRPSQPSVAAEIASLRDKMASLEAELQESNDKVKDLEANVERLQREKEDALREERDAMKIDKEALQNLVKALLQDKDELEGKFDAAKKEAEKREEDKKKLENELERMKNELEKLRRDKDQDIKNFEELQQTLERTGIKMGELNDRYEELDKDRREISAERNSVKEEKKTLEVLLETERVGRKKYEMLVKEVKDVREQLEKEKIEKMKHMEELKNAKKELEKFYKAGNFKMKFECSQQLEQQLRDEIRQLKQENAHLVRGAQTGVNREAHGHYGYQHGGEDIDLIVATLRSENSHLLEQNRQQKKYFEHQYQVLSEQYHDSQRIVEELKEESRHSQQQQQQLPLSQTIQSLSAAGEEVCESMPNAVAPRERLADSEVDREAHQARIDQLQVENCDLKIKLGELHRRFLEFEQHPRHHEHSIPPHQGDAYRYNESDEMTRSSLDSSLEQSISNLPPPISRVRPVIPQTTSHTSPILPHNRVADRDGITQEIKKAEELKKPPKGLPVADDVDEKLWPYDPNLDCPHCGKRFRHGQIREFRYHIDDEHSSSSIM